jgi:hypothetical protein
MDFYQLETVTPLFFYKAIQYFADKNPLPRLLWAKLSPGHYSLGAGQTAAELSLAETKRLGLQVLRRPTGGGLVWVEQEYVFAVLLPLNHPWAKDGYVLQWLQDFYQQLNVDTTLIHNDLWQGKRKLAGSASAHVGNHWLFTSSFLQDFSVESFSKTLLFQHPLARTWFEQALAAQITDAKTLGIALDFVNATLLWQHVLQKVWTERFSCRHLSDLERQQIENTDAEATVEDDLVIERRLPGAYKIRQGSYLFDQSDLLLWLSDGFVERLAMPLPLEKKPYSAATFWQDLQAQPSRVSLKTFQCFQKFWQKIHDEYPNN